VPEAAALCVLEKTLDLPRKQFQQERRKVQRPLVRGASGLAPAQESVASSAPGLWQRAASGSREPGQQLAAGSLGSLMEMQFPRRLLLPPFASEGVAHPSGSSCDNTQLHWEAESALGLY
jgi:hypothetical protein